MSTAPARPGSLSGYNPEILVMDVQRLLTEAGVIFTSAAPSQGTIALAADLLRCLGVEPVSTPVRQPGHQPNG